MGEYYKNRKNLEGRIGLNTSIKDFTEQEESTISVRLANALRSMSNATPRNHCYQGIHTVGDLINRKHRLYRIPNFGNKTLVELNSILSKYELPILDLDMKKKRYHGWRGLDYRGYRGPVC